MVVPIELVNMYDTNNSQTSTLPPEVAQLLDAPSQVEQKDSTSQRSSTLPPEVQDALSNNEDNFKILGKSYPLTQGFMNYDPTIEKYSGGYNYGDDFGAPVDTPVSLPKGQWKVIESSNTGDFNRGYGNSVMVQNTETGEKLRFSHLSQTPLKEGQLIDGGIIGDTGDTGNVTGPHLDLEYYDPQGNLQDIQQSSYGRYL